MLQPSGELLAFREEAAEAVGLQHSPPPPPPPPPEGRMVLIDEWLRLFFSQDQCHLGDRSFED